MRLMLAALRGELLKAYRSPVPAWTAAGFTLAPMMGGLFMFILKDPARARAMGLLGAKAQLTTGTADWPTFLGVVAQATAVGGSVLFAIVTAWIFAVALLVGYFIDLPDWSGTMVAAAARHVCATAVLAIVLEGPIAFLASAGRGYLAPLGFALLMVFIAQITAAIGWGTWFPWAVPALFSGIAGPRGETVGATSVGLVVLTGIAGFVATLTWWKRADHTT